MRRIVRATALALVSLLAWASPRAHAEDSARLVPVDTLASARLVDPAGLAVDVFGRVWVSDATLHRVVRFAPDGALLDETGALGSDAGLFRRPGALATAGALGVAVLDRENRRVVVYDHFLRRLSGGVDWGEESLADRLGRVDPVALATDRGGALHVADADRDRVLEFDFAGSFVREWGGYGGRAGGFNGLAALTGDGGGRFVAVERPRARARRGAPEDSSAGRSRVQWFESGGRVTRTVWTAPWAAGAGETGIVVAIGVDGRVALAAERSGEVVVLDRDGREQVRARGFAQPRAIAFDGDGRLLVGEAGAARVVRWAIVLPAPE